MAQATQAGPQVGQADGQTSEADPQTATNEAADLQIGQISHGYQWNGTQWVPVDGEAAPAESGIAESNEGVASAEADAPAIVEAPKDVFGQLDELATSWQFRSTREANTVTMIRDVVSTKPLGKAVALTYQATASFDTASRVVKYTESLTKAGGQKAKATAASSEDSTFSSGEGLGNDFALQAQKFGGPSAIDFDYENWHEALRALVGAEGFEFISGR